MDAPLPPIPTPAAHGWRRFRQQLLPGLVFVGGLASAILVWTQWVAPTTIVGEAEPIRADVRSAHAGTLAHVVVRQLQPVHAGDTLAQVIVTDPQVFEASISVIRAELEVMRYTMDPVIGQQRAVLDYERLMLDLMSARVTLASLNSQLHQAESDFARAASLHAGKLITEERFEETKNKRDALLAQVKAQTDLVNRIEPDLKTFRTAGPDGKLPSPAQGLRAALKLQEEKLRLAEAQLKPVALIAPIDGIVTLAYRKAGEVVTAGEPIFQISAPGPQNIIGFIRQPVGNAPTPGTAVAVRTRSQPRRTGTATIAQVGVQLEPISPTLLAALHLPVTATPTELGLRVHVTVPPELGLRPGEQVDLFLRD